MCVVLRDRDNRSLAKLKDFEKKDIGRRLLWQARPSSMPLSISLPGLAIECSGSLNLVSDYSPGVTRLSSNHKLTIRICV
jgi:hypothetical protein